MTSTWSRAGRRAGVTPLSETYYEAYLYFSGGHGAVRQELLFDHLQELERGERHLQRRDTSFSAPSVASSRNGGTLASTNYDSPADYSCRQNFIVYLTDGLPNEAGKSRRGRSRR